MKRYLTVGAWLLTLALGFWFGLLRNAPATDLSAFLPISEQDEGLLEAVRNGAGGRTLVLLLSGSDPARLAAAGDRLVAQFADDPRFTRVLNRTETQFEDPLLFRYRYLLNPRVTESGYFEAPALEAALRARLAELRSPFASPFQQWLANDPTGAFRSQMSGLRPAAAPLLRDGRWFTRAGEALVLVQTRAPGLDLDAQQEALATLGRAAAAQGVQWQAVGPGAFAVASREVIRNESRWLSLVATLAVAVLLRFGYRSWSPLWAAALPIASAIAAGAAATVLLFGHIHGIAVAFGATLIGVALDYPVHLFSHQPQGCALTTAADGIWPTLRLGAFTTALAYLALTFTGIGGLAQLGIFAAGGLVTAVLTARYLLPLVLPPSWHAQPRLPAGVPGMPSWLRRTVVLAALGLSVAAVLTPPRWQDDPAALSTVPAEQLALEKKLRRELNLAEPGSTLFVTGKTPQAVLERSESLRPPLASLVSRGLLGGYELLSDHLPSIKTQRARQAALPGTAKLAEALKAATAALPFKPGLFAPFLAEVEASRSLAPLTPDSLAAHPYLGRSVARLAPRGPEWSLAVPLVGIAKRAAVEEALAGEAEVEWVDLRQSALEGARAFRHRTTEAMLAGLSLIVAALFWRLRPWKTAFRVVSPVLLALATLFGGFAVAAVPLTLFHLVTLVLVGGIAIDYALFFARHGSGRDGAATAHAVTLSAVSTVAVFGILAASDIPVLAAIGTTAAFGVATSLLLTLAIARPAQD